MVSSGFGLLISSGLALLGSLGAWLLARAHLRRVRAQPSADAGAAIQALRDTPLQERPRALLGVVQPESWEAALATDVLEAPGGDARAVAIDLALGDLEAQLVAVRRWSETGLRVGLLGGLLGGSIGAIVGGLAEALTALAVGALGAGVAGVLGRRARGLEATQRRRADDLVTLLVGGRVGGGPRLVRASARRGLDRSEPDG